MNLKDEKRETDNWAIPHGMSLPENYEVMRQIRESLKWTAYLAKDGQGNKRTLTYVDDAKILERYKVSAFQRGLSPEEAEREAVKYAHEYKDRLLKMVENVRDLGNEHVAAIFGASYDKERDQLVIISDYTPGVDLAYAAEKLNPMQLVCIFAQILSGIDFIHKNGFLHLNIKPSRIYVDFEQDPPQAQLTDFGFAVPIGKYEGESSGTLLYMAPEVVMNRKELIDERADLYSFGVTMYTSLTGRFPLENRLNARSDKSEFARIVDKEESVRTPPSFYNKRVPKELDELIIGLLEKKPDRRKYAHADVLLSAFNELWPKECSGMTREGISSLSSYD
ncbi:MAG: serine/threonine-protein kinase [bacterium]